MRRCNLTACQEQGAAEKIAPELDQLLELSRDGLLHYVGDLAYFSDDFIYFEEHLGYPWPGKRR